MKVGRGALGFGVGTVISRGFGLIREVIFAYLFGASPEMDAFRVAFNIPNLFRESLAEGSLTPAFVPLFSDHYTRNGKGDAFKFANLILGAFLLIVGTIVLLGVAFSPVLVKMISFGFTRIPGKFALTVMLTRIMFPFLLIITISALFMGILNFFNQFFITGVAPTFFNIGIIATGLLLAPKLGIRSIAVGAVIGGLFQLIYQLIPLMKRGFRWHPHFKLLHPDVKHTILLMLPIALGYGATKINTIINTLIASFLQQGAIAYLSYAFRLTFLPIGVIGVALANVTLPLASKGISMCNIEETRNVVLTALRYTLLLTIMAFIFVYLLSEPICRILYERGNFTHLDTLSTASALRLYALSIIGVSITKVLSMGFYSLKDTRTPMKVSFITIAVNAAFALGLVGLLGFKALALALSMASIANALILFFLLNKRVGLIKSK